MENSRWSRGFGSYHRIIAQSHSAPGWALEYLSVNSPTLLRFFNPAPYRARAIG
ncbi:MAG TPA: hypothetical protein PLL06_10865 [Acidobacteriota bacterium]|nr:hypothetical protein [Acidobacteriota bacterium]HMZ80191.1 hypothetical protein [Acidobacteriota bacterium]HNG93312.1 hypothetical protein [Acidobacteriota bacterium]HNJ39313.1 hypothetical protein [Acidobacteriota bacterium]